MHFSDHDYVCPSVIVGGESSELPNPFREFILPLAYENVGLLHAVLGLSECHLAASRNNEKAHKAEAIEHRIAAIHFLSAGLRLYKKGTLSNLEETTLLAIILILLLHDVSALIFQSILLDP